MSTVEIMRDDEAGMVHVRAGAVAAIYERDGAGGRSRLAVGTGSKVSEFDGQDLEALAEVISTLKDTVARAGATKSYVEERASYRDGL